MRPMNRQKRHSTTAERKKISRKKLKNHNILLVGVFAGVASIVLWAHWPALSSQAVSFDDKDYLTQNRLVQNPSWASVLQFLTEIRTPSTVPGYYQPLNMISLMLDAA